MHELDWLRSADAPALLEWLYPVHGYHSPQPQSRKLRLYYVALGREVWRRLPATGRALIEVAEHIADDPTGTRQLLAKAQRIAERLTGAFEDRDALADCERELRDLGIEVAADNLSWPEAGEWKALTWLTFLPLFSETPPARGILPESYHRADLVRDIFSNPFHQDEFVPTWRSETAIGLARRMYEGRSFAPMPILADALEDAGCRDLNVLAHCRDSGPHVRGCWVLDRVLDCL